MFSKNYGKETARRSTTYRCMDFYTEKTLVYKFREKIESTVKMFAGFKACCLFNEN